MSTMEIILIVCACCIPVLAILMSLPKKKSGEVKTKVEDKPTDAKPAEVKPEVKEDTTVADDLQADVMDYETYIREQRQQTTKPEALEEPTDVKTEPLKEEVAEQPTFQSEGSTNDATKQELENLSPELKAMLLAGVLEKKDFDEK